MRRGTGSETGFERKEAAMAPLSHTTDDEARNRAALETQGGDEADVELDDDVDLDEDDVDYDPSEDPDTGPPASGDGP
jgi:hypothetical protein